MSRLMFWEQYAWGHFWKELFGAEPKNPANELISRKYQTEIIGRNRPRSTLGDFCTPTLTGQYRKELPWRIALAAQFSHSIIKRIPKDCRANCPARLNGAFGMETDYPPNFFSLKTHLTIQAAAKVSGYNAQYLRRLLPTGQLQGDKIGQIGLIRKASFDGYLKREKGSNDRRWAKCHRIIFFLV